MSNDDSFQIKYAAHTATCTFLLDREGICRRIVVSSNSSKRREAARAAQGCVGAQYVASLDASVTGMLAEMPRVGGAMLFARVDTRGRVSLVRTGVVTRFETQREVEEDPFSTDRAPSVSVQTSAPEIAPSVPTPRRSSRPSVTIEDDSDEVAIAEASAASPEDLLDQTAEYQSDRAVLPQVIAPPRIELQPETVRRPTWPSPGNDDSSRKSILPPIPTLRQPPAISPPISAEEHDEHDDIYATLKRGTTLPLPPHLQVPTPSRSHVARRSDRMIPRAGAPRIEKVTARRRGTS